MERIFFVEVACAAVASPLAWERYIEECRAKYGEIKSISCRDKSNGGWKRYSISISFKDGKKCVEDFHVNTYLRGFNHSLYNRFSCHDCQFRNLKSGADLTIADYWHVARKFPEMDDDCGTSLVLVNTSHGMELYSSIKGLIDDRESDFEDALCVNPMLARSPMPHAGRRKFFVCMHRDAPFSQTVKRLLKRSFRTICLQFFKRSVKRMVGR